MLRVRSSGTSSNMEVAEIIEKLGGREAFVRKFGVSRTATYNWRYDGIPFRLWPDIVAEAQVLGVEGITFDVLKATRPSK